MNISERNAFERPFVVKFGGSILADGERISRAVEAVVKKLQKGTPLMVVVSAMGKTTDYLLGILKEVTNNYFDPANPAWPIITNKKPTNVDPLLTECEERISKHISPLLQEGIIPVLPGFIEKTVEGEITTLGRGGSDITAFVVARALKAKQVILVTDVNGVMTADPKLVFSAKRTSEIDVNSLIGLASSGTKFIQRKALKYKDSEINVKIINHCHCYLEAEGTIINGSLSSRIVYLEFQEPVASIIIVGKSVSQSPRILHQITQTIRDANVPLLGVSANIDSIIFYILENMLNKILDSIHLVVIQNSEALSSPVRRNLAMIKIKTAELEETPGIISHFVQVLFARGINVCGIFTVASGIQVFVDVALMEKALTVIKDSVEDFFSMNCTELKEPQWRNEKNV